MAAFSSLGPNMRRLGEMELANTVEACVVAGPGDLLTWEVRATVKMDGLPLQVAGRGPDIESSAASVLAELERNANNLDLDQQTKVDKDPVFNSE
jgi:hypothetical protein